MIKSDLPRTETNPITRQTAAICFIVIVGVCKTKYYRINKLISRDVRFGSIMGQIGPKWDKSGTFSYQSPVN